MNTASIVSLVLSLIPGIVSAVGVVQLAIKQHESVPQIIGAVLQAVSGVTGQAAPAVASLPAAAPAPASK